MRLHDHTNNIQNLKFVRWLALAIFLIGAGNFAWADNLWIRTGTGIDLYNLKLASDPSNPEIIYAAADGVAAGTLGSGAGPGLYKSINSGLNWQKLNIPGIGSNPVNAVVIDPQTPSTLYAAAHKAGIFKSTDAGMTWKAINNGIVDTSGLAVGDRFWDTALNVLVIDPKQPSTLYTSPTIGVFKSVDGGNSWTVSSTELQNPSGNNVNSMAQVISMEISPSDPRTLYIGTLGGGGLYKTTNGAASWAKINAGMLDNDLPPSVHSLAVHPSQPNTVYAGTHSSGLFKSIDGGVNWKSVLPTPIGGWDVIKTLEVDPLQPETVYAGVETGPSLYKSTDGGILWAAWNEGLEEKATINSIIFLNDAHRTAYVAGRYIYRSTEKQIFSLQPGAVPQQNLLVTALGVISNRSVDLQLRLPYSEDLKGQPYQIYVIGLIPGRVMSQADPILVQMIGNATWTFVTNPVGQAVKNISPAPDGSWIAVKLFENSDLSALVGTEIYVGYGTSELDMLQAARFIGAYKIRE